MWETGLGEGCDGLLAENRVDGSPMLALVNEVSQKGLKNGGLIRILLC